MLSFLARADYAFPAVTFNTLHKQTMTRRPMNAKSRHILQEACEAEKSDFRSCRPFVQRFKIVNYLREPSMVESSGPKAIVLASLC
jgi:hypothetical protein